MVLVGLGHADALDYVCGCEPCSKPHFNCSRGYSLTCNTLCRWGFYIRPYHSWSGLALLDSSVCWQLHTRPALTSRRCQYLRYTLRPSFHCCKQRDHMRWYSTKRTRSEKRASRLILSREFALRSPPINEVATKTPDHSWGYSDVTDN